MRARWLLVGVALTLFVSLTPLLAFAVTGVGPNSDIPGQPLPSAITTDFLNYLGDVDDVWSFPMELGQYVEFDVSAPLPLQFDTAIFAPSAKSIWTATPHAIGGYVSESTNRVGWYCYKSGTYYLDVAAYRASGFYEIRGHSHSYEVDDEIPGALITPGVVGGWVAGVLETDDVYALSVAPGSRVRVSLTTTLGLDATLRVFGADATAVGTDTPITASEGTNAAKTVTLQLAKSETSIYVDVHGRAKEGTYTLSCAVLPKARVGTPVAPRRMSKSKYYSVYGSLRPRHTKGSYPVRIYKYRYVGGAWKSGGYVKAKASNYSSYTKYARSIRLPYAGKWRLRAYAPADSSHAASWSSGYDYVTVR
ncbi:MAG: hypothetical protein CVT67_03025 [Actinobacteria bacterium HGW-Actinobacteria-7]|nr:MAG: hypothetical protein CVT67_03025 [Actinobacteria bacterium HGW-Actinobacteria-7]